MRDRRVLISAYAKRMIALLEQDFPDLKWYLTLVNNREVCIGVNDQGKIVVSGHDYETIKATGGKICEIM